MSIKKASNHTIARSIEQYNIDRSNIIREILDDQGDERVIVGCIVKMRTDDIKDILMSSAYDWYHNTLSNERKEHLFQRALIGQNIPRYVYGIVEELELHDEQLGGGCNRYVIDWFLEDVFKGWDTTMNPDLGIWEYKLALVRMPNDNSPFDSSEMTGKFKFASSEGRWRKAVCEYCCTYYCLRMLHFDSIEEYCQNVRQYKDVSDIGRKMILDHTYTKCTEGHESMCVEGYIDSEFAVESDYNPNSVVHYITDME